MDQSGVESGRESLAAEFLGLACSRFRGMHLASNYVFASISIPVIPLCPWQRPRDTLTARST
jgi:hypothetical protein